MSGVFHMIGHSEESFSTAVHLFLLLTTSTGLS